MTTPLKKQEQTERERAHAEMLEEALKQPGVRESMEVFENWRRADKGLEPYRLATKRAYKTWVSDHTNPRGVNADKMVLGQFGKNT